MTSPSTTQAATTHAASAHPARLPPFDTLVAHFPNTTSVVAVKRLIGGRIDDTQAPPGQQWLGGADGDTCTIRMSRALNYSGAPIPSGFPGMVTVHGADHLNYAFRVQELHAWLIATYGPPDVRVPGKPASRDRLLGRKGLILFDIKFGMNADGATRALGHADLWDGTTFFDEIYGISSPARDFFDIADAVSLWATPGAAMLSAPVDA